LLAISLGFCVLVNEEVDDKKTDDGSEHAFDTEHTFKDIHDNTR